MNNDGTIRSNLKEGMQVTINPQTDRTRKHIVKGYITNILTNAEEHPHGILVEIDTGEKGRVKEIIGVFREPYCIKQKKY